MPILADLRPRGGLHPVGGNSLLAAQFKTGKTTLLMNWQKSLLDQTPFLGIFPPRRLEGRVAFWNYEVIPRQMREWYRKIGIRNTTQAAICHLRGYRVPLTTPGGQRWTIEWLKHFEVEIWILDPFARAFLGDENSNSEVGRWVEALDYIKQQAGVVDLVLSTHTGRMEHAVGQERARGATRLDDWCDVRWVLTKDKEGKRFFSASGRDVQVDEFELSFNPNTLALMDTGQGGRVEVSTTSLRESIVRAVRDSPGMTTRQLRLVVQGKSQAIDLAIKEALESGLIRQEKGHHNSKLYFPATARRRPLSLL